MGFVSKIGGLVSVLPPKHKTVFSVCLAIFILSVVVFLWQINQAWLVAVPSSGGEYAEGLVGIPRFINPLLATSAVDRDLTTLIYSGLMRNTSDGKLIPDLALSYTVSPDGLTYQFTLKPNLVWHDGEPVTAGDVIFTINKAQEPSLKSPRRASLEGITMEKIDDQHLTFHLRQPYPLFLENMTLGILPAHRWQKVATEIFSVSELNRTPIGTGPYQLERVVRDGDTPLTYTFVPFSKFALGEAKISKLIIYLYQNTEALLSAFSRGEIEAMSAIDPLVATTLEAQGVKIISTTLPRVFGLFFNQNQARLFTRPEVRQALNLTVDREKIVAEVFNSYAKPLTGPLLLDPTASTTTKIGTTTASEILKKAGWQKNALTSTWELPTKKKGEQPLTLGFTISTSDAPELKRVAEFLKHDWEAVGVKLDVKIFESGALVESVIRPREYEALLYGEVIGRNLDLYSFWHSTQRLDPGLNIALYANLTVDKILDQIRIASTTEERASGYLALDKEIRQDEPAVFLYAPDFLYVVPDKMVGIDLGTINTPSERFLGIYNWHIKTDRVWPIFIN